MVATQDFNTKSNWIFCGYLYVTQPNNYKNKFNAFQTFNHVKKLKLYFFIKVR